MKNYYDVLNINKEDLELDCATYEEQNSKIRVAYIAKMEFLEKAKKYNTTDKKKKETELEIKLCEEAYKKIKTPAGRFFYNREISRIPQNRAIYTAYDFFKISETEISKMPEKEADVLIEEKLYEIKNQLDKLDEYSMHTNEERSEINKFKVELNRNYERIKNNRTRNLYNGIIDKLESEYKESQRKQDIKQKYECYPDKALIKTIEKGENRGKKFVKRVSRKNPIPIMLNERISIAKTAEVKYINCTGACESYVSEYAVLKDNKINIIYTNLDLNKLDKKRDSELNEAVTEKLLSDEMLQASKLNHGYIGNLEKDENGEYILTLDINKRGDKEREEVAAVSIMSGNEKRKKDLKQKKEESGR